MGAIQNGPTEYLVYLVMQDANFAPKTHPHAHLQIYYVSLSAKGKFYEIEQHSAPVLQKPLVGGGNFGQLNGNLQQQQQGSLTGGSASSSINNPLHRKQAAAPPRHLSRDCVHRIGFIMQSDVSLPVNLRLISPQTGPHSIVPGKLSSQ